MNRVRPTFSERPTLRERTQARHEEMERSQAVLEEIENIKKRLNEINERLDIITEENNEKNKDLMEYIFGITLFLDQKYPGNNGFRNYFKNFNAEQSENQITQFFGNNSNSNGENNNQNSVNNAPELTRGGGRKKSQTKKAKVSKSKKTQKK